MIEEPFFDFSPKSKNDWIDQVKKDLKGKDFDQNLVQQVWGEIPSQPFYTLEDLPEKLADLKFHEAPTLPGTSPRVWNNVVPVFPGEEKKTNEEILHVLDHGAEGLVLHLQGDENLHELLKGVMTEFVQLYFIPENPKLVFNQLVEWVEKLQIKPSMLQGGILWSPASELFNKGEGFEEGIDLAVEMINRFSEYLDFYPVSLDTVRYADAGANGIQQLYLGMGEMIEFMDAMIKKAVSPAMLYNNMAFYAAVGDDHFPEIAKLKALRLLLLELAFNMGQEINPSELHLVVTTSLWSKSYLDKNTNLIRQTYEAMAAILGGANTLFVRPLEREKASQLESRVARNISAVLKEEAYLDKVMDPSAGSYYLENLIKDIKAKVLEELEVLEDNGGWLESFHKREIHSLVRSERDKIQKEILEGGIVKVGANKYLSSQEEDRKDFEGLHEKDFELRPSRATYLLEMEKQKNS